MSATSTSRIVCHECDLRVGPVQVERDAAHCRVRIEFDKFHATSDSKVVTTGRYWLHRTNSSVVTKKEFNIVKRIEAEAACVPMT